MKSNKSRGLFHRAKKFIPGGVNSPVRAWKDIGVNPVFIRKGDGSKILDADGRSYTDYVMSYGPLILGHAHPAVVSTVKKAADKGTTFGSCTEPEVEMAETICSAFSGIEKVRMVNSGTEAVMSVLRLARGFTGKRKVVKFDGCYHGHADAVLVKAGSSLAGKPDSLGVLDDTIKHTVSLQYNDLPAAEKALRWDRDIACVIVEPVCGNMGVVPPQEGFLKGLRELTDERGILLVFDEVITGFRLCYGGAQDYFKVKPDLTCLGKIIGGGLPVGAYGGREDVMDCVAPEGGVFQAGTISGNPIALSAGLATLRVLKSRNIYSSLRKKSVMLRQGLLEASEDARVDVCINHVESMLSIFFTPRQVTDYASARTSDRSIYSSYFKFMLSQGVMIPPSRFESWFMSTAHTLRDVDDTIAYSRESFKTLHK